MKNSIPDKQKVDKISALQNPMPILCVETIEAVIDEMYAPIFIFIFL